MSSRKQFFRLKAGCLVAQFSLQMSKETGLVFSITYKCSCECPGMVFFLACVCVWLSCGRLALICSVFFNLFGTLLCLIYFFLS